MYIIIAISLIQHFYFQEHENRAQPTDETEEAMLQHALYVSAEEVVGQETPVARYACVNVHVQTCNE